MRAYYRVRAPYAPRGQGEHRRQRALARLLKEVGLVAESVETPRTDECPVWGPRLYAQRPRASHSYGITLTDVWRILAFFGVHSFYGLRAISLIQGEDAVPGASLHLGRLLVPGRIVLYDHRPSPWLLPGRLVLHEQERLRRAGALVELIGAGHHTVVSWPGETLRDFILFDVLMHEVGHHMIQQYTGKYRSRVLRTRDHEAIADRFAAHCRRVYPAGEHAL